MDNDAARAVMAGFLLGYAASIVFTGVVAVWIVRLRAESEFLGRALAPTLTPWHIAVPVSFFAFLGWTMLGMVAGVLLAVLEEAAPRGGLGSPNLIYTVIILASALLPAMPFLVLMRSCRRPIVLAVVGYAALFGWALPHLAL